MASVMAIRLPFLLILNRHFQGDLQLYANFSVALRRKADRQ